VGEGGGGRGEGIGLGSIGTIGHGAGTGTASSLLSVGNLAGVASAAGVVAGGQFIYSLPEAVSLHAHASALLPFVDRAVDVRPVTWLDGIDGTPRSAVRFVNSLQQTLPAGTIALFEAGGFAGEAALDRLEPGEQRFVTYGVDLDVTLTRSSSKSSEAPQRVIFAPGVEQLELHYLKTTDDTYVVENRSVTPRSLVLTTHLNRNGTISGADGSDFDTASGRPLVVFKLAPSTRAERTVHTVEGLVRQTSVDQLTADGLRATLASSSLPGGERGTLTSVVTELAGAEDDKKAEGKVDADITKLKADIERLKEEMKALGDAHGGRANPFAAKVLAAEDKLATLRAARDAAEARREGHRAAARTYLLKLTAR
jgi:hypothetical protein